MLDVDPDQRQQDARSKLAQLLSWSGPPTAPEMQIVSQETRDGYLERLIQYRNVEDELVPAFLLVPDRANRLPGVVVQHQHNGERHLGKSEVMGYAGNPLQAFGPKLAQRGFVVLAPDAACFEDRRRGASGTEQDLQDDQQHYDEMAYRLARGSLLMSLVVSDAAQAVSVLAARPEVDPGRVGMLGQSMGGHTTLFTTALDERVRFACISGAFCGYQARMNAGVGLELAQIIPGIVNLTDFDGLLALIAPRRTLIVSADEDPYSFDAPAEVESARITYARLNASEQLTHARYEGGHALTSERVHAILNWTEHAAEE